VLRDGRMRCSAWIMLLPLLLSALSICCLGICTEQHAERRAPPRAVSGVSARRTSHTRAWPATHMVGPHTSCPRRTRAAIDLWCAQCACRSRTASRLAPLTPLFATHTTVTLCIRGPWLTFYTCRSRAEEAATNISFCVRAPRAVGAPGARGRPPPPRCCRLRRHRRHRRRGQRSTRREQRSLRTDAWTTSACTQGQRSAAAHSARSQRARHRHRSGTSV
jgi:hypothetical protein